MKLVLSNLAWDKSQNEEIIGFLLKNGISNIECVFSKIENWSTLSDVHLVNFRDTFLSHGINCYSAQSLFYGVQCESIFDEDNFLNHFQRLIHSSKILGIKVLVLGSPNLRKLNSKSLDDIVPILKSLDNMLLDTDIKVVIEPNSSSYGGEFFFTIEEIVGFLSQHNFKNIKTMIDTHNSELMSTNPIEEITKYLSYVNHIHISEINLKPLTSIDFHQKFSNVIKKIGYDKMITFEVLKCDNIEYEVSKFKELYQ